MNIAVSFIHKRRLWQRNVVSHMAANAPARLFILFPNLTPENTKIINCVTCIKFKKLNEAPS